MNLKDSPDFARIQQVYKCCGIEYPEEWLDEKLNPNKLFPMGCCNRETIMFCAPELQKDYFSQSKSRATNRTLSRDSLPHFSDSCSFALNRRLEYELFNETLPTILMVTLLNLVICYCSFKSIHCTAKIVQKNEKKTSHYFPKSYITNAQIRSVVRDHSLLSPEGRINEAFNDVRERFLQEKLRISWMFRRTKKPIRFVTRFERVDRFKPGQLSTSPFRRMLRCHFPLLEAILYTNGNEVFEFQANAYYGSLSVFIMRALLFLIFGFLMATLVLLPLTRRMHKKELKIERLNEKTVDRLVEFSFRLEFLLRTLIIGIFLVGSIFSLRFRTTLVLILPTMGLNTGRSLVITTLVQNTFDGPVENILDNIETIVGSLRCFSRMIGNMSSITKQIQTDSYDSPGGGGLFLEKLKDEALEFIKMSQEQLMPLEEKTNKLLNFVEDWTRNYKNLFPKSEANLTTEENKAVDKSYDDMLAEMDRNERSFQQKMVENLKLKQDRLLEMINPDVDIKNGFKKVSEVGHQLDSKMRDSVTKICISLLKNKAKSCMFLGGKVCESVSKKVGIFFFLNTMCAAKIKSGCAGSEPRLDDANTLKCIGKSKEFSMQTGLGAAYHQARNNLMKLGTEYLQLNVTVEDVKKLKDLSSISLLEFKDTTYRIFYYTRSFVRLVKAFATMISVLNMLILIKTIKKASKYLKNYMTDLDFDNIYLGTTFDNIDSTRKRSQRAYLRPLKSWEKNKLQYKKVAPTKNEVLATIGPCMITGIVVFGNYIFFLIDKQIYQILDFLRELMYSKMTVTGAQEDNASENFDYDKISKSEDIFSKLLYRFLVKLQEIGRLKLDFSLAKFV
ncbi:hypothetical protein Ciccas_002559 [Cichlidogyrus casuarinus]|uniref:Dendritic cell-specific transmembrane protein-like domain-containing protein n=1 Tax=Cichlidogyrus casuarinus TaxID=1844966 RepID=A0ABD2QGV6_9PLAT